MGEPDLPARPGGQERLKYHQRCDRLHCRRRREQKEELGEEVCVIGDALKPETYVDEFAKAKKLVM